MDIEKKHKNNYMKIKETLKNNINEYNKDYMIITLLTSIDEKIEQLVKKE